MLQKGRANFAASLATGILVAGLLSAAGCSSGRTGPENAANLPLVEVARDKVILRAEPDANSVPKMLVNRGLSLPVESRSGDWIKVLTPYGAHVWVQQQDVTGADQIAPTGEPQTEMSSNSDNGSYGN